MAGFIITNGATSTCPHTSGQAPTPDLTDPRVTIVGPAAS